jgi:hypothetical protein
VHGRLEGIEISVVDGARAYERFDLAATSPRSLRAPFFGLLSLLLREFHIGPLFTGAVPSPLVSRAVTPCLAVFDKPLAERASAHRPGLTELLGEDPQGIRYFMADRQGALSCACLLVVC